MKFLPWLARRAGLVWLAALALTAAGVLACLHLPTSIYPEVEFSGVRVVARSGDAPPEVTQLALARPLESALATVLGVERMRSRTIRGAVDVSLQFAPGTDMWRALQLTQAHVGEARGELPSGTEVVVERLTTTSFPVITYNLTGAIDPRRLREIAELVLKPALSRVRGVGSVEVMGGDVRELEVILDPDRVAALHLGPAEVAEKLRSQTVLQAVGRYDEAHSAVTVLVSAEPSGLDDLRALPIAVGPDGSPVPLGSIARVEEGAEDRVLRVSGPGGETVLVSVARLPGTSTPEVVARVRAVARDVAAGLPPGVHLTPVYDQAALVEASMRSVRDAILEGILLCVVVIALFLRDLRGGLIAAAAVPSTLAMTFVPMALFGQSLNLMSLGGLAVAIGLVIDDAIVVVEAIGRRIEAGASADHAADEGTRVLLAALIGTTATTVVVFLPLAWLPGVVGSFFVALAVTLSSAVLISLLVAVLLVPLASRRLMRPRPRSHAGTPRADRYSGLVGTVLRRRWVGPALALALVAVGALSLIGAPTGFLPSMDEGAFVLDYFLPAGTSLDETDRVARKLEIILAHTPEVRTYSRRTGAELGPATATLVNTGDFTVRLASHGERHRDVDEVIAEVRARIAREVPETRTEFMQLLQDVLNDLAGTPNPIEIKLFGADYAVLRDKAAEVVERIREVPGLVDLYPGFEGEAPELRLRVDAAATARLGTTAERIAADLDVALHGVVAASVRRPDRAIGVRVRYDDAIRFSPARVQALPITVGTGGAVPIASLTRAERGATQTSLLRENLRPVVIVTGDREDRDLGSVMRDVRARLATLRLPEGYRVELGGQYAGQQEAFAGFGLVLGFGLVAVLLVLLMQFRRARLAFLVLGSVPLALVGAFAILRVTDMPLNASSLMGLVLLVGLVVKNGILLLEQYERLCEAGMPDEAALVEAGRIRVRPILMTTLATLAGLTPLAIGVGAGAEIQRPLAVAVIGGLVASTVVSLFVLPSFARLVAPHTKAS